MGLAPGQYKNTTPEKPEDEYLTPEKRKQIQDAQLCFGACFALIGLPCYINPLYALLPALLVCIFRPR